MSAYSLDLREKIIAAIKEGEGKAAVARRFKVDVSTVKRYVKLAEAGCLKAKAASGPPSWLTPEAAKELKQQVEDHNDWTLEQHAEALGKTTKLKVKKSAIAKYFKKLNITRKKKSNSNRTR